MKISLNLFYILKINFFIVKLLMYYIKNHPNTMKESVFASKLQIWPSLCKLLNNVQKQLKLLNYSKCMSITRTIYLNKYIKILFSR